MWRQFESLQWALIGTVLKVQKDKLQLCDEPGKYISDHMQIQIQLVELHWEYKNVNKRTADLDTKHGLKRWDGIDAKWTWWKGK